MMMLVIVSVMHWIEACNVDGAADRINRRIDGTVVGVYHAQLNDRRLDLSRLKAVHRVAGKNESLKVAALSGQMLEQRDQHLISRVARLRTGVESNRRGGQVRSEGRNRPSHSGARRDAGDRRPLASGKAIVAAL